MNLEHGILWNVRTEMPCSRLSSSPQACKRVLPSLGDVSMSKQLREIKLTVCHHLHVLVDSGTLIVLCPVDVVALSDMKFPQVVDIYSICSTVLEAQDFVQSEYVEIICSIDCLGLAVDDVSRRAASTKVRVVFYIIKPVEQSVITLQAA
jgi:hypothetical protein